MLLIDCVSAHIHLALKYMIINTNFSLKYYLQKHDPKQNEEDTQNQMNNDKILKNSNTDLFMNKYEKIKEYSTLLCHIYEI